MPCSIRGAVRASAAGGRHDLAVQGAHRALPASPLERIKRPCWQGYGYWGSHACGERCLYRRELQMRRALFHRGQRDREVTQARRFPLGLCHYPVAARLMRSCLSRHQPCPPPHMQNRLPSRRGLSAEPTVSSLPPYRPTNSAITSSSGSLSLRLSINKRVSILSIAPMSGYRPGQ